MEQRDICQRSIPWLIGYEEAIIEVQSKKSSFAGDILAQSCTGPIFTYSCTYITLVCSSVVAIVQYVVCCPKFVCVLFCPECLAYMLFSAHIRFVQSTVMCCPACSLFALGVHQEKWLLTGESFAGKNVTAGGGWPSY